MRGVDRPWPEAALALAAVAAGLAIAGLRPSWDGWKPATCVASGCFCESPRARGVRQPADAWSNLAFLAVGLWISLRAGAEGSALTAAQTRALGFMTVFIGAGSLLFHASLTLAGEFLDVMGMYALPAYVILLDAGSVYPGVRRRFGALFGGALGALAALLYFCPQIRREVFAALLAAVLGTEAWLGVRLPSERDVRRLGLAAATALIGFVVWVLDERRIVCAPESLFQGHALWHCLMAAAAWQLYAYLSVSIRPAGAGSRRPSGA